MANVIDPKATVFVRRQFVSRKSGNFYPEDLQTQRLACSIPSEYRTEEYLAIVGTAIEASSDDRDVINTVVINPPKTLNSAVNEIPLLINSANEIDLLALKHVGEASAKTLVEQRSAKPFESIADLNNRAPLPRGRDWSEHASRLVFGEA